MELPNLSNIIETYVPLPKVEPADYFKQLRKDVLPHIRKLQADGHLRWFSFLIHSASQITGYVSAEGRLVIHLRLEPIPGLKVQKFIELLPDHFQKPRHVRISEISGLDGSILKNDDWAYAWKILGESSEWLLCLIEGHKEEPPIQQIVQFLHYITNSLVIGNRCLFIPTGFLPF